MLDYAKKYACIFTHIKWSGLDNKIIQLKKNPTLQFQNIHRLKKYKICCQRFYALVSPIKFHPLKAFCLK